MIDGALIKIKLKATSIHFGLSFLVFIVLAYHVFYSWYPLPYFLVDGGWQGLRIIAAVDLVLGPLITFLIFDLSKSRQAIVFDLLTIAIIQISALTYGVHTTYEQRPVAVVLIDDFVIPAVESDYGNQMKSLDELHQYSDETLPIIYAYLPLSREALNESNRIKIEEQIIEHAQIQLYQPTGKLMEALQERQPRFFDRLESDERNEYVNWLELNNTAAGDVLIAPFNGRYGRKWLVFDKNAKYLDYF